jgi:tetratricopeptide (TPR) repeat protein
MSSYLFALRTAIVFLIFGSCGPSNRDRLQEGLNSANLLRGDIALCGSDNGQFGKVSFASSCIEGVAKEFDLGIALLHSFEYAEAEKVFAGVIDQDPECVMAYWGIAMSNFHPLWTPPSKDESIKGNKIIALARSIKDKPKRETDYLEAVAKIFDDWQTLDYHQRVLQFEKASEEIYQTYPEDKEAAVFYALALRAAADPTDKTFAKQRKSGEILNSIFADQPGHPGVAHYIIHTYDYPGLATLALPAARKYAAIAGTSAHALHMPSHIFTRLGLWEEAIQSNISSISAAKCYAESAGIRGHWDEELHGIDYLVYGYLQKGEDENAKVQLDYLSTIDTVSPVNSKTAYTFAAVPTRWALEQKKWSEAAELELKPANFPWTNFPWESSVLLFGKLLGAVHIQDLNKAQATLSELKSNYARLLTGNKNYEANQVAIQIKASEAWIKLMKGKSKEAVALMSEAAAMEEATEKHPVTPGEVVPSRELLGDMLMELKDYPGALEAYEADLKTHPGRFNALFGAGLASQKNGNEKKARVYFQELIDGRSVAAQKRKEWKKAEQFLKKNI